MPPSLLVIAFLAVGCAGADGGDDFSNNLFSDLAPILALFGERVTMQYLSQSMGWSDCILLAVVPLGIVTTIVSAIRVGGPPWLKTVVGRSRENLAAAEMELMSSTSHEACELWNGKDVVRCLGSPSICEFICVFPEKMNRENADSYSKVRMVPLKDTLGGDFGKLQSNRDGPPPDEEQGILQCLKTLRDESWITIARNTDAAAPNITLNRPESSSRRELHVVTVLGVIVQLAVVFYFGFITYYPTSRFEKDGQPVRGYEFPVTAAGTLLLFVGMLMCSHVVDSGTDETRYKVIGGKKVQLVWLQTASKVSDQVFLPAAIYRRKRCEMVTTSSRVVKDSHDRDSFGQPAESSGEDTETSAHSSAFSQENHTERTTLRSRLRRGLRDRIAGAPDSLSASAKSAPDKASKQISIEVKTLLGTATCLVGFIVQFIGLRGMHWSASVTQLAAILIMTALRTWVRRGFTGPLDTQDLTSGHELDWFVLTLANLQDAPWCKGVMGPEADHSPTGPAGSSGWSSKLRGLFAGETSKRGVEELVGSWVVKRSDGSSTPVESSRRSETGDPAAPYLETSNRCTAQGVLKLRAGLASLAGWRGPVSTEAIRLSAAMEVVLNAVFLNGNVPEPGSVSDDSDAPTVRSIYTWGLEIDYAQSRGAAPECQRVEFSFFWDPVKKSWKVRSDEIDAALSLWLYSTKIQHARGESDLPKPKGSDWLQRTSDTYRKLGPYTHKLAQDLGWWMPAGRFDILHRGVRKGGSEDKAATGGYIRMVGVDSGDALPRYRHGELRLRKDYSGADDSDCRDDWWDSADSAGSASTSSGSSSTSSGSTSISSGSSSTSSYSDASSGDESLDYRDLNEEVEEIEEYPGASRTEEEGEIASIVFVESHDTIGSAESHAKEIFSSFMDSVAARQKRPLDSQAGLLVPGDNMDTQDGWKCFTLHSNRLSRLARDIHNTGLQSLHEAYLSIITPFSFRNLLPPLDAVVRQACEQGKRKERLMRGDEASEVYGWLLAVASRYPSRSSIYRNAVPIAIQYLEARKSQSAVAHFHHPSGYFDNSQQLQRQMWEERPLRRVLATQKKRFPLVGVRYARQPRAANHRAKLHLLSKTGDVGGAIIAMNDGASPDETDIRGLTPLHYACQHGDDFMAEMLLERRVAIDAQSLDGSSPLHLAALNGHDDVVDKLMQNNASTRLLDNHGRLPIHCAAMNGHLSLVERWIADASAPGGRGRTALHYAAWFGRIDVLKALLSSGRYPDPDPTDYSRYTPLHLAATRGHVEAVEHLIMSGANISATCVTGSFTPLHFAVIIDHIDIIALIVKKDPSTLEARDRDSKTPLDLADDLGHDKAYAFMTSTKRSHA